MSDKNESAVAPDSKLSPGYRLAYGRLGRDSSAALLDQGIVSGSRFITTIFVGRVCGAQQLGEFALAFQLSVLLVIAMESLVSTPYMIFCNRYEGKMSAEYAGSVLLHCGALALLAMVFLGMTATLLSLSSVSSDFGQILWILAAITPFIVLREFGRRFAFAHLRMRTALALDVATAVIQIGGLAWLAVTDSLSAGAALWVMGLAAAVTGTGWLIHARRAFSFRMKTILPTWLKNWAAGRWLFGSSIVASGTDASIYWLLAFMSGLTATGIFAACMTIVQLANPVLLGLANVLQPSTARAFAEGGRSGVRQIVKKGQLSLGILMSLFCVVIIFVGADAVAFVYHGVEYTDHDHTVIVLGLFLVTASLELSPSFGLRIIEKANLVFVTKLLEALVILAIVIVFARDFGMVSAAYALLIGGLVSALLLTLTFFREAKTVILPLQET